MVGSRTLTALVGIAVSVAISVAAWYYFDTLLVFLVLPFVPLLFRGLSRADDGRAPARECPTCGFTTRSSEVRYCPRDGSELRES
ncbi:hypothetical protein [Halobaculum roseum]|uniref:Zinc ribbon domain-containing protein n=1 Tax=Halobaculum roseum TaxID=2175149 RepID=A0ABD5MKQ6_9EURY|nr:hypothetical protein [Halobaculum roseum]QZY04279.1 hypothetical protein K6T36_16400 [Halobaculum roseum]